MGGKVGWEIPWASRQRCSGNEGDTCRGLISNRVQSSISEKKTKTEGSQGRNIWQKAQRPSGSLTKRVRNRQVIGGPWRGVTGVVRKRRVGGRRLGRAVGGRKSLRSEPRPDTVSSRRMRGGFTVVQWPIVFNGRRSSGEAIRRKRKKQSEELSWAYPSGARARPTSYPTLSAGRLTLIPDATRQARKSREPQSGALEWENISGLDV